MENCIKICGVEIPLSNEQMAALLHAFIRGSESSGEGGLIKISEDGCFTVGKHEFVVLERGENCVKALLKDILVNSDFGKCNNYDGSKVDAICNEFGYEIAWIVGEDNLLPLNVDLTSNDGLRDYGAIKRRAALLTAEQARRYVDVLDRHKLDAWWWLATPYSTPTHEDADYILRVAPSGRIGCGNCYSNSNGVRPFCIFNSDIFVS